MTPIELRFLLECYYSPNATVRNGPEREFAERAVMDGILSTTKESGPQITLTYQTTKKGNAWVKAILSVPVPELRYIDQLGRIIDAND